MSARREDQQSMTVAMERGAARTRVTESGSPARVPHGESRLPVHRMRLRSHAGTRQSDSNQVRDDGRHSRTSPAATLESSENWSEATTEIASPHEALSLAPVSPLSTSHEETPDGPFLTFTPSPTRDESRIWEYDPSGQQDFVIWEDPPDEEYPVPLTPIVYSDIDEDKENTYATVSDYDSHEDEDPQDNRFDWRLRLGPRDAFGLPLESTFGHVPPETAARGILTPRRVPTAADTNVRPAVRAVFRGEEESDEDWDETLSNTQVREIQELTDIYVRGAENRHLHDRHAPMRDFNAQGQANIFLEVRRITEFQRHRDRRHSGGEGDEE